MATPKATDTTEVNIERFGGRILLGTDPAKNIKQLADAGSDSEVGNYPEFDTGSDKPYTYQCTIRHQATTQINFNQNESEFLVRSISALLRSTKFVTLGANKIVHIDLTVTTKE